MTSMASGICTEPRSPSVRASRRPVAIWLARADGEAKSPLLAFFLRESRLDRDEIQELRALLDRLEGRKR